MKYKYISNGNEKLVIVFQGFNQMLKTNNAEGHKNLSFYKLLTENEKVDYLFIYDTYSSICGWYILNYNKIIIEELNKELSEFILEHKYNKENVFTFGSSKGGTGALLYGLINPHIGNIYSLVPQIDLFKYFEDKRDLKELYDNRYLFKDIFYNIPIMEKNCILITGCNDSQFNELTRFSKERLIKFKMFVDPLPREHSEIIIHNLSRRNDIINNLFNFVNNKEVDFDYELIEYNSKTLENDNTKYNYLSKIHFEYDRKKFELKVNFPNLPQTHECALYIYYHSGKVEKNMYNLYNENEKSYKLQIDRQQMPIQIQIYLKDIATQEILTYKKNLSLKIFH